VTPGARRPLEAVLVERGLAADADEARALVAAGRVLVANAPAWSPRRGVAPGEPVSIVQTARFVGRGGEKLDAALDGFAVDVAGVLALDVGASTGGFTDCLLARGARRVLAVDVGHGQLHERLLADARVVARERTNVRDLTPAEVTAALGGASELLTADVAFASLAGLAPHLVLLAAAGQLVVLVKPQFEADRRTVSRGRGVVDDPAAWRAALGRCASAFEQAGAGIMGAMASPLPGASGNVEFFLHARVGAAGGDGTLLDAAVDAAPRT
jgi:23S rRNA (cytidine1920-2'-O)/16S rRNA (cytidine1409-2'-O)-methyltransferase